MTQDTCAAPVPFPTLVEYWLGELDDADERGVEEHLLGCGHCAGQLGELAALASGIRSAFRRGAIRTIVSDAFLKRLAQAGMRVREYRVPRGGSVHCAVSADDDVVIGRLEAPLMDVMRLDLLGLNERGEVYARLEDIPFDASAGEVLFCPPIADLKQRPAHTDRVRLIAKDAGGERLIGEYTFIHTPTAMPSSTEP